jgi:ketosteroid isomerase-like protein
VFDVTHCLGGDTGRAIPIENVDIIRGLYDAFNRRSFDEAAGYLHPEGEVRLAMEPVESVGGKRGPLRGRDELRMFFQLLDDSWDAVTVEIEEFVPGRDGRLLVMENWRVRGPQGVEMDTKMTDVFAFRDGLVFRCDGFRDKPEALEAFGPEPRAALR